MSISFNQFAELVESVFPNPEDRGHFRNFTPEFVGREYYTWQDNEGFKCVAYDTMMWEGHPDKRWSVSTGRGSVGYGNTIFEAEEDEKEAYDNSFNLTV